MEQQKHLDCGILSSFPPLDGAYLDKLLAEQVSRDHTKLVVLDDDPTGVQTVHDVSVYTDWSEAYIRQGFAEQNKLFYILTNSRGMTPPETEALHRRLARTIDRTAREFGVEYMIMSRSDSTLRGHYPLETQVLYEELTGLGTGIDGEILCPFFLEGGRYTIGNVHYVQQGDELVPAAETEFARDATFGYHHSSLPEYIQEKTRGAYPAEQVLCVSLEMLRGLELDGIQRLLEQAKGFRKICVNAVSYEDLKVFTIALYRAMARGKRFLCRTAAGLVKVAGNISDRPLLTRRELRPDQSTTGGLVVVGSHTAKTTRQLERLLERQDTVPIEFDSDLVLRGDRAFYAEVDRCVALEEQAMAHGKTAVCFTKRRLLSLPEDTRESALLRSVKISDGVQRLVGQLRLRPGFVIAKGGITSSDIGTKALGVKRANVMGQILPGIPVWQLGPESTAPGIPYIIFPGNTGDEDGLRRAVEILTQG